MKGWLLVGAMGVETLPLLRRLEGPRPLSPRLVQGRLGSVEVAVLTAGVGPEKAYRRTLAALALFEPGAVISFGTCGALVEGHAIGDLRTGADLLDEDRPVARLPALADLAPAHVTTVARPCFTREDRHRLATTGAQLVEMEAAAVWKAVQTRIPDRPFYLAKVVSDRAGGEEDAAIGDPSRPDPVAMTRFQARALSLVERRLAPAIATALRAMG